MDPALSTLSLQLGDVALRNTAGAIADKIGAAKARKRDRATIAELEEIINGLLSDKSELVRIAKAYEEELVAQRISESDIHYMSDNVVPLISQLAESAATEQGQDPASIQRVIDLLEPILSVETVTVLQLLGFNFRRAIGEPLTQLVSQLVMSKAQGDPTLSREIERLRITRELAYVDVAKDEDAYARLMSMFGQGN